MVFTANYQKGNIDTAFVPIYIDVIPNTAVSENQLSQFNLLNNYPNPFYSSTIVQLDSASQKSQYINVVDMFGREVAVLKRTPEELYANTI